MHNVLVVDDELSIRESFSLILQGKYQVLLAASGEAALKTAADQKIDLAFLDIRMPGLNGLETLKRLKEIDPDLEVIMVTAVNDVQKASEAVKLGARDYIIKPFDVEGILKLTEQVLRRKSLMVEGQKVRQSALQTVPELIGQHEKIVQVLSALDKIRDEDRVLIIGETGTEKETVARLIHEKSRRAAAPFVAIHFSKNLPTVFYQHKLFGRAKGSSTVELSADSGLFEQVRNGTILLNNLEALPKEISSPLLALEFSRAGSGSPKLAISSRLIGSASSEFTGKNKELFEFFSKAVIKLPALRERSSDLPLLVNYYLDRLNARFVKEVKIEAKALDALANYSWPGNADELSSLLERLVLTVKKGMITLTDLPLEILLESDISAGGNLTALFEQAYIKNSLQQHQQNKESTAAYLKINPQVLESRL